MTEDAYRGRPLEQKMRERLGDLLTDPQAPTVLTVLSATLTAERNRPRLSGADRRKIQENYPPATDRLIKERAMSEAGLADAVSNSLTAMQMSLDYSPLSHTRDDIVHDMSRGLNLSPAPSMVDQAFVAGRMRDFTPFGIMAGIVHVAVRKAMDQGVSWPKVARLLVEVLRVSMARGADNEDRGPRRRATH